jgi:hypothetical protein
VQHLRRQQFGIMVGDEDYARAETVDLVLRLNQPNHVRATEQTMSGPQECDQERPVLVVLERSPLAGGGREVKAWCVCADAAGAEQGSHAVAAVNCIIARSFPIHWLSTSHHVDRA